MPGIAGIISRTPPQESQEIVKAMLGTLQRNEPFQSATFSASKFGVYAASVAHKGSFAAAQPFRCDDQKVTILISGECFDDFSPGTADVGSNPETRTGEWMTQLYAKFGEGMFERINGMFSGLLIDEREGKAFLFNDRYGSERLYWHQSSDAFYFAS